MKRFIILLTVLVLMAVPLMAQDRASVQTVRTTDQAPDESGNLVTQQAVTGIRVFLFQDILWDLNNGTDPDLIDDMLNASIPNWHITNWNMAPVGTTPEELISEIRLVNNNAFYVIFNDDYWDTDTGAVPAGTYEPPADGSAPQINTSNERVPFLSSFDIQPSDFVPPKILIYNLTSDNPSDHYVKVGNELNLELKFSEALFQNPVLSIKSANTLLTDVVETVYNSNTERYNISAVMDENDLENRQRMTFDIDYIDNSPSQNPGNEDLDQLLFDDDQWLIFDKSVPALSNVVIEVLDDGENPTNLDVVEYEITWYEDFVYNFDVADISCIATDINGDPVVVNGTFEIDPEPVRYNENVDNTIRFTMDNADFNGTISFVIQDEVDGIEDEAGNNTTEAIVVADGIDYDYVIDNTVPGLALTPDFDDITTSSATISVAAVTDDWYPDAGFYYKFVDADGNLTTDYQTLNDTDFPLTGLAVNTQYTFTVDVMDYAGNVTIGTNEGSFYTSANPPTELVVDNPSTTTLDVHWDLNESPGTTEYKVMSGTDYVQADGSLDAAEFWQSADAWNGGRSDVNITVIDLTPGTEYTFEVTGRNGDNATTGSINGSLYTLAEIPVLESTTHPDDAEYYNSADLTVTAEQDNGDVSHYRYLFNAIESPVFSAVQYGTLDNDGEISVHIPGDGTFYMHVVAFNGDDEPSTDYATYMVNYDGSAPTELDVTVDEVQVDQITVSGSANFDLADAHATAAFNFYDGTTESDFVEGGHTFTDLDENAEYTFQMKARDNAIEPNVNADWGGDESSYTLLNDLVEADFDVTVNIDGFDIEVTQIPNGTAGDTGYDWWLDTAWEGTWGTDNTTSITGLSPNQYYESGVKTRNGDGVETTPYTEYNYTLAETPGVPTLDGAVATAFDISYSYGYNLNQPEAVIRVEDLTDNSVYYVQDVVRAYTLTNTETWLNLGATPELTLEGLTSNTNYQVDIKFRNGDDIETAWSGTEAIWTTLYTPVVELPDVSTENWYNTNTTAVNISQDQGTAADAYTFWVTTDEPGAVAVQDVIDNGVDVETTYGWDEDPTQVFDLIGNEITADNTWYLYAVGYNGGGIATGEYGYTYYNYAGTEPTGLGFDLTAEANLIEMSNPQAEFGLAGANATPWAYNIYINEILIPGDWVNDATGAFPGLTENTYYEFSLGARDAALPDFNETESEIDGIFTLVEPPLAEEITFTGITTSSFTANVVSFTNDFMVDNGGYNFQLWEEGEVEPSEESGWQTANSYPFDELTEYENYTVKVAYRNAEEEETIYAENTVWTLPETPGTLTLSNPQMISIDRDTPEIYTMDLIFDMRVSTGRAQEDALFAIKAVYNDGVDDVVKWVDSTTLELETIADDPDFLTHAGWFGDPAAAITVSELEEFELYTFTVYALDSETGDLVEGGNDSRWSLPSLPQNFTLDSHTPYTLGVSVDIYDDRGAGLEYWYYLDSEEGILEETTPNSYEYSSLVPNTAYDLAVKFATPDGDLTDAVNLTDQYTNMATPGTPITESFAADWNETDQFTIDLAFDAVASGEMGNQEAGDFAIMVEYNDGTDQTKYVDLETGLLVDVADYNPYPDWMTEAVRELNPFTVKGLLRYTQYTFTIMTNDTYGVPEEGTPNSYWTLPLDVETVSSETHSDDTVWYSATVLDIDADMGTHPVVDHFNFYVSQNATETADTVDELGTQDTYGIDYIHTFDDDHDGTWYAHAIAYNPDGNYSNGVTTLTVNFDNDTPYCDQGGFTATDITTNSIEVTVEGAADDLAGLNTEGAYLFEEAGPAWQSDPFYTFTDLAENTPYNYQVTIRDNAIDPNEAVVSSSPETIYTLCEPPTSGEIGFEDVTSSSFTVNVLDFPNDDLVTSGGYYFVIELGGTEIEDSGWQTENTYPTTVILTPYEQYTVKVKYRNGDEAETAFAENTVWTQPATPGEITLSNPQMLSVARDRMEDYTMDVEFDLLPDPGRAQEDALFAIKAVYNDGTSDIVKWVNSAHVLETTSDPYKATKTVWYNGDTDITVWGLEEYQDYTFTLYYYDAQADVLIAGDDDSRYSLPNIPQNLILSLHDATSLTVTVDDYVESLNVDDVAYYYYIDDETGVEETDGPTDHVFSGLLPNTAYDLAIKFKTPDGDYTEAVSLTGQYTNMTTPGTPDNFSADYNATDAYTISLDFTAVASGIENAGNQALGNFAIKVEYEIPDGRVSITKYVELATGQLIDTPDYHPYADWITDAVRELVPFTVKGLTRYTIYTFTIETDDHYGVPATGTSASYWTLPLDVNEVTSDTHVDDTVWYNNTLMNVDAAMPVSHPEVDHYKFYASQNATETADTVDEYGSLEYTHTFGDDDDGTWYIHAIAYNPDGNYSEGATSMTVNFDNDAPTYDTIVVTDTTATSITIEVNGATDNGLAGLNEFAYIYYDGMPDRDDEWTGDTSWTFTDLDPNSTHELYVGLRDDATNPNEALEGPYTVRTMAVTPAAPSEISHGSAYVRMLLNLEGANFDIDGLANEIGTEYALYEETTGMYLDYDWKLESSTPVWRAIAAPQIWGAFGLTPETSYEFKLVARNDDNIETEMSDSLVVITDAPTPSDVLIHLEQSGEELTPGNEQLTVGELFDIEFGVYELDQYGQEILCYNYDYYTFFQTNYPNNLVTNSQVIFFIDGIARINNAYVNSELDDLYIYLYLDGSRDDDDDCFQYGPLEIGPAFIDEPGYAMVTDNPDDQGGWINLSYELSENDPFYEPSAVAPYVDYYVLERQIGTAPVREEIPGIYEVVAFIMPYNPTLGNMANVLIEVPASDSVFNYRIAAVFNAEPYGRMTEDEPVVIYADEMEMTRDAYTSGYAECGSTNAADNIGGYADFTVYLEGAYSGGIMSSGLDLPLESPYDGEVIDALPVVDGHSLIDWVQVELRSSATGAAVKSCNAFLLEDGSIVDVTGKTDLPFYYTTGNDYYVVINHRNHVAVMTAESFEFGDFASESTMIDLATSDSAVYGSGIKNMGTDFAMYAADVTGDGFIGNDDMNTWAVNWGTDGYLNADVNLDGTVGSNDINSWLVNWAKQGTVPVGGRLSANSFGLESQVNSKQSSIHYGISNAEFVEYNNGDVYYEFDIIANSDRVSHFYSGQVFLGYDTEVFGTLAIGNGDAFVNGMELVDREIEMPGPAPAIDAYNVLAADFDKGILSTGSVWNPSAVNQVNYENANIVNTVSQNYLHVAMKCNNIPESEDELVWFVESDLLAGQQAYLDQESNWHSFEGLAYDAMMVATPEHDPVEAIESHISGVYPNPFNPTTTLYFELGEAAPVSLEIYNIRGQKVRTMEMGELDEGTHNVSWNGTNNQGADCGSGVYFLKLSTGSISEMTRVLMLK